MTPQAYLYICDGDIDNPVLTHKKMDWPKKYPHWQEIPLVMAQRQWVGLTDEQISDLWCKVSNTDFVTADTHEFARAIEAAHGIRSNDAA